MLRFVQGLQKSYVGEVVLGTSTSTLDASGEVTGTWDMSAVTIEEARAAAKHLTGSIQQIPPMVSAIKVGGTRLHTLARQGVEIDRAPRSVTVERFDVTELSGEPGVLRIEVDCSTGTYVRSLAADLGEASRRRSAPARSQADEGRLVQRDRGPPTRGARSRARPHPGPGAARSAAARGRASETARGGWRTGLPVDRASARYGADGDRARSPSSTESGRLLAVYESAGPDRIVAACVLAS